jgi:hypothetical protein
MRHECMEVQVERGHTLSAALPLIPEEEMSPTLEDALESFLLLLSSPGLTGFSGCVMEDSWLVREDILSIALKDSCKIDS